jgi:glycine/D-amino acid oxidase-like deaminating enzyme
MNAPPPHLTPTPTVFAAPEPPGLPPPGRTQVAIIGGGLTGLAVASGLRDASVDVHLFEASPQVGSGMATCGLGIATTLLMDPPTRLIAAVGLSRATEILAFSTQGVAAWGDALTRSGVAYASKGDGEAAECEANLEALERLGIAARPWEDTASTGLGPGWHMPNDGVLDLGSVTASLSQGLSLSTHSRVVKIEDDGLDLAVLCEGGQRTLADLVIMTGGAQVTGWAADKFHPVRHQVLATAPTTPCIPVPMHIQYGYTSIRQLDQGQVLISGCRWASPHLEMGETDAAHIQPNVDAKLTQFLHSHWPRLCSVPLTHRYSAIMSFSCDGLPIIGPQPGRSRIISCGGFGAFSPSLTLRAAHAVVEGVTTGESTGVPECFSTRRFD